MSKVPVVGITIGDLNGIGPEVVIKTLLDNRITEYATPVIYANPKVISYWKKVLQIQDFNIHIIKSIDQAQPRKNNVLVCWDEEAEIKPGEVTEAGGKYALLSLNAATHDLKNGKLHAIVTAPLNKHNIKLEQGTFTGHTEYLAKADGDAAHSMLLVCGELRVALVTGHIPLKEVAQRLSVEGLLSKINILHESLKKDFSIAKPRIAVLGLNPHAGDNGLLGNEDLDIISPACKQAQANGQMVYGPYPADGFFGNRTFLKFDAVLAIYHDQGLIPFKLMGFENGINFTAGLSFIRTSPDHGTAYDIAGKNKADETSMRNALYTAIDLVRKRNENFKLAENFLPITPLRKERFRIDF
ncbi:MAG: 4-hydroxythreonine-4-phosphate dehydrogenase PdxA [Bacteroidia bacterium]|jgi:4-hydroxythreonine-4-phosphate dehydrogenase|nr:4-hydroxythreonine-4-phosphate dehydrogenase PdxA [Bacteroidia bacterium]